VTGSVFDPAIRSLPSGYTGLPRELVEASQRQRLMYAVVSTVGEKGYGPTTIADIAAAAGVSKKTFYEHFADKQACFLAAYADGSTALLAEVVAAARAAVEADEGPVEQLRRSTAAYLGFMAREELYARVFFLETFSAGRAAVARQRQCRADFSASLRRWHGAARRAHPEWPDGTALRYEAATAAVHEVALGRVATGKGAGLPRLLGELVEIQLAVLRVPVRA
jgi:AcrR family transcriptional regulator